MGCNTSKDSAQAVDKKTVDNKNENQNEENASKEGKEVTSTSKQEGKTNSQSNNDKTQPDPEEAATKIQAVFRGHKTRKTMKQANKPDKTEASKNTTQKPQKNDVDSNKEGLEEAATKIQASFRGHLVRKQIDKDEKIKPEHQAESKVSQSNTSKEELDVDLSDPNLNDAAVKIQATFRGHMSRKEHEQKADNEKSHEKK